MKKYLWPVTKQVLKSLADQGIGVMGIVTDMGPGNQAMWRDAGIVSSR